MQEMTGEQAVFLLQNIYLGTLKNGSRITKKIIEAVPAEKCEHRPDPTSRSAIELTRHIAAADRRFLETGINGAFDTNAGMLPVGVKTPAQLASWYGERVSNYYDV